MTEIISCCGMVCSECEYFHDKICIGCPEQKGEVFWLQYVDDARCPVYACCVDEKELAHCGKCGQQPCARWADFADPNLTPEEALAIQKLQLDLLQQLP